MEWRLSEEGQLYHRRINRGDIHVNDAGRAPFQRWNARPRIMVFALDRAFLMQTILQAFEIEAGPLRTEIGVRDPVLSNVMDL